MGRIELTVDVVKEAGDEMYVATFREIELASQGGTVSEAFKNVMEAFELFMETASESEIRQRLPVTIAA